MNKIGSFLRGYFLSFCVSSNGSVVALKLPLACSLLLAVPQPMVPSWMALSMALLDQMVAASASSARRCVCLHVRLPACLPAFFRPGTCCSRPSCAYENNQLLDDSTFLLFLSSSLQDCTESDPYAGYEGALLCMDEVDSGGDIAFVKQSTVQTYSGDTALTSASDKVSGDCWFSDLPFLLCSPCSRH